MKPARVAGSAGALAFPILLGLVPVLLVFVLALLAPGAVASGLLDRLLWIRLGTTALVCLALLALVVPIGLVQAWLLVRTRLPGARLFLFLAPLPFFLPPLVHVLATFRLLPASGFGAIVAVYWLAFQPLVLLFAMRDLERVERDEVDDLILCGGRRLLFAADMFRAFPSALAAGALACVMVLSDFAVADFLTSTGPKIAVYADSLHAFLLRGRVADLAWASLPGMAFNGLLLWWALCRHLALGPEFLPRLAASSPLRLGRAAPAGWLFLAATILPGSLFAFASLALQTGSLRVFADQFSIALPRAMWSLGVSSGAALVAMAAAIPLALAARRARVRPFAHAIAFLPFAAPALVFGIGITRTLNRPLLDLLYVSFWSVLLVAAVRYLAFAHIPLSSALSRLDPSHEEAAALDGAGPARRIAHVLLPLSWRPLALGGCIVFAMAMRELDTFIMLRAGQNSLTYHLYANVVFARADETAAIALMLMGASMIPLVLFHLATSGSARRA